MGVRDVLSEGAQELKGLDGKETTVQPRPSLKQRLMKSYEEGAEVRAFGAGLGLNPGDIPLRQTNPAETAAAKGELSVAERIVERALTAAEKATESARTADRESMTTQLQYLREEIKEAKQGGADPMETYLRVGEQLEAVVDRLKGKLGVSPGTVVQTSDLPAMIQLESLKMDREERQRQHDEKMKLEERHYQEAKAEREHQWDKEEKRWAAEFTLKKLEFDHKSGTQDQALEKLGTLIESVTSGIQPGEGGGVGGGGGQPRAQNSERSQPTSFKCTQEGCEGIVQIPATAKPGETVTCPQCQTVYDL